MKLGRTAKERTKTKDYEITENRYRTGKSRYGNRQEEEKYNIQRDKEGMLIEMFEKMKTEVAKKRETVAELV